jgi:aspartate kinase
MIVLKFGGTSVSSEQSIKAIAKIVKREKVNKPVIVVSALSGITNLLVSLTKLEYLSQKKEVITNIRQQHLTLTNKLFNKTEAQAVIDYTNKTLDDLARYCRKIPNNYTHMQWQDNIVAYGETLSSFLIANYLSANKINAKPIIATQLIVTNKNFGSADFIKSATIKKTKATILPLLKQNIIPIITGFIGQTDDGHTTTLGRGGSDYSAAIIGYALKSTEIQIWTDVDGVYSADPRIIKEPKLLENLSYQEAAELAIFGAKVLHPRTILPAILANIPVRVLNTFNITSPGTTITSTSSASGIVKAITTKNKVPLINIYSVDMFLSRGFLKKIFNVFAKYNISVDLVSASEVSVSVTLDNTESLTEAIKYLGKFTKITQLENHGSISLIGEAIMQSPHLMSKVFTLFEAHDIPVHMVSYSAANINIGLVMPSMHINNALKLLHKNFINP